MRPRTAAVLLALLVAAAGIVGCGHKPLFTAPPAAGRKPKPCTLRIQTPPSAMAILVHHDSATSRAELRALLLTAEPNEHFFLFKAATGKLIGSFTTPPGPALPGPIPPPPLPSDPTQVQVETYRQAVGPYDRALTLARGRLHLRWLSRLAIWASHVMNEVTPGRPGPHMESEVPGLVRGLTASGASITSLNNIPGIHLGPRIVVAVLGLNKVPTSSPPPLPSGVQEATIVIAGFAGSSSQEATWQSVWTHGGARRVVLLTPSTDDELPAVVASVLNQGDHARAGTCAA
jgi:hypothetical protein